MWVNGKWKPRRYSWPNQKQARAKGSAKFKRALKRPAACRFCSTVCKNIAALRWHMTKEHK